VDFVNYLVFQIEYIFGNCICFHTKQKKNSLLGLTEGAYLNLSRGRDELLKQDASNSYHATFFFFDVHVTLHR